MLYLQSFACILEWMVGGVARGDFVEYGICSYQLEQPWCWGVIIPSGGLGLVSYHLHLGTKQLASVGGICEEASGKCQNERETQISKGCFSSPPTPCN